MGATKWTRHTLTLALCAALTACGSPPLSERDPHGFEACSLIIRSRETTDFPSSFEDMLQASREAKLAVTPAIRDAFDEVIAGYGVPDAEKLVKACGDEGVEVPEVTAKDPGS
jgi:hypothetical protein